MCGCNKRRVGNQADIPEEDLLPVPLGLSTTIGLPIRFPDAVNGKDIIVTDDESRSYQGVVTLYGRQALVQGSVRRQLAERYPHAFSTLETPVEEVFSQVFSVAEETVNAT